MFCGLSAGSFHGVCALNVGEILEAGDVCVCGGGGVIYSYLHDHFKNPNLLLFFITLRLMPKENPIWFGDYIVKLQNRSRASSQH